jgi:thioredoxin-like negative regulator of GroEL
MPLPSHLWQQYRQQHAAHDAYAAAPIATKQTTAAAAVLGACEQQQQQGELQGEAADCEDEQCLQLLQQFEQEQGFPQVHAASADGSDRAAALQQSCCSHINANVKEDEDEYAQCLQLLQEVEGSAVWGMTDTG